MMMMMMVMVMTTTDDDDDDDDDDEWTSPEEGPRGHARRSSYHVDEHGPLAVQQRTPS